MNARRLRVTTGGGDALVVQVGVPLAVCLDTAECPDPGRTEQARSAGDELTGEGRDHASEAA
jgi:hypothetical protein